MCMLSGDAFIAPFISLFDQNFEENLAERDKVS